MKIKSKDELVVKSFVQSVSSATTFGKRFKKVSKLLEMRPKLTDDQWIRIWRGMYYCIWYSEMTKGGDLMAQKIGSHEDIAMLLTGFKSVTNDWFGIDAFRLDKYMFLVRIMTNTSLKLQTKLLLNITSEESESNLTIDSNGDNLKDENQNELKTSTIEEKKEEVQEDNEIPESSDKKEEKTTKSKSKKNKSNKKFDKRKNNSKKDINFGLEFRAKIVDNILMTVKSSIGLTLHLTDIFIDELVRVWTEFTPKLKAIQKIDLYLDILLPFVKLMAISEDHRLLNGVKHNIFDKFKSEVLITESIDSRKQILQRLIDGMIVIGGNESVVRRNRDAIYDIIGAFKTKLNQLNTNNDKSLKRKKILIGRGRHKKVKYEVTSSSPFVTSIIPIAVV